MSNDNDCQSPELTIYSKNSKLNKSSSHVDESTTGDNTDQPLLATINEQQLHSNSKDSRTDNEMKKEKQKMIITGDDILIEYV